MASEPIYAEYIGATNSHVKFDDVRNRDRVPFRFIIAFATDRDGNGNFIENWKTQIEPTSIQDYKEIHDKTEFILSIGWYDNTYPFRGIGEEDWVNRAFASIKTIIQKYHVDGIDICYSASNATPKVFAKRLGELIKKLKGDQVVTGDQVIKVASITPTPALEAHYRNLYDDHRGIINYVHYRFYDLEETPRNVDQFKKAITDVKNKYPNAPNHPAKLLVGNKTDNSHGKIPFDVFSNAYKLESFGLRGIFGWSDGESPFGFPFETEARKFLEGNNDSGSSQF